MPVGRIEVCVTMEDILKYQDAYVHTLEEENSGKLRSNVIVAIVCAAFLIAFSTFVAICVFIDKSASPAQGIAAVGMTIGCFVIVLSMISEILNNRAQSKMLASYWATREKWSTESPAEQYWTLEFIHNKGIAYNDTVISMVMAAGRCSSLKGIMVTPTDDDLCNVYVMQSVDRTCKPEIVVVDDVKIVSLGTDLALFIRANEVYVQARRYEKPVILSKGILMMPKNDEMGSKENN